jgi:hypothetical protein
VAGQNFRVRVCAVLSFLTVMIASLAEGNALGADLPPAVGELKTGYALKAGGEMRGWAGQRIEMS